MVEWPCASYQTQKFVRIRDRTLGTMCVPITSPGIASPCKRWFHKLSPGMESGLRSGQRRDGFSWPRHSSHLTGI